MSLSKEQQKKEDEGNVLFNEYVQQYKTPLITQLATFNQNVPNVIDQLIQQCVRLVLNNQEQAKKIELFELEKTMVKPKTVKNVAPDRGQDIAPDAGKP